MSDGDAHATRCPLAAVDRRLADTHDLWHQAEQAYFEPDAFRLAIQNCIQTLRSVTFILQSNKRAIPDFDDWYATWQAQLRADPLMRWMVEARNRIEKQGDLIANSFVRAEIVASYLPEGPAIEVPARLFEGPADLLRSIPEGAVADHVQRNGTLLIERRWVENSLPDRELLEAVAEAYGRIAELVADAHRQAGLGNGETVDGETGETVDRAAIGWRMPCMVAPAAARTLHVRLSDGAVVKPRRQPRPLDLSDAPAVMSHYGADPAAIIAAAGDNETRLADAFFEIARRVFLRDGYHGPMVFLLRGDTVVRFSRPEAEDQQQKYLIMRELAAEAARLGADGVIAINEVWLARSVDLAPYQHPADFANRREGLSLAFLRKADEPVEYLAEIYRCGDEVSLGDTQVLQGQAYFAFAPFYAVWDRPIPEAWLAMGAAAMAQARSPDAGDVSDPETPAS